jgi:hypothetical protein
MRLDLDQNVVERGTCAQIRSAPRGDIVGIVASLVLLPPGQSATTTPRPPSRCDTEPDFKLAPI